jgi:hypothetical protein
MERNRNVSGSLRREKEKEEKSKKLVESKTDDETTLTRRLKNEKKRINYIARHQNGIPTYKYADRRKYNSLAASIFLRILEQTAPFLSKEIPPDSRMTEKTNIIRKTATSLR